MIEKRKVERFDLQLDTFVSSPGGDSTTETGNLITKDISMCGVFLITDKPLPVGAKVKLDMILSRESQKKPDAQKALIKASGAVLRTDKEGMAVGFDENSRILPFLKKS